MATSMEEKEPKVLKEFAPLSHLMNQIPTKFRRRIITYDVKLTCFDVLPEVIVIGTNTGMVLIYGRENGFLGKLYNTESTAALTCVKAVSTVEFMFAVATAEGRLSIFQIPKHELSKVVVPDMDVNLPDDGLTVLPVGSTYYINGYHKGAVTALAWSQNGMRLCSGDSDGLVILSEIDFLTQSVKTSRLWKENHPIVQLSYCNQVLVMATTFRTLICLFNKNYYVNKVGSKDRIKVGDFGAQIVPGFTKDSHGVVFESRPGLKVCISNLEGRVIQSVLYKPVLLTPHPGIELLDGMKASTTTSNGTRQFGKLQMFCGGLVVTWSGRFLAVLNPVEAKVVCSAELDDVITDLSTTQNEIFFIQGKTVIRRLAFSPEKSLTEEVSCISPQRTINVSFLPELNLLTPVPLKEIGNKLKETATANIEKLKTVLTVSDLWTNGEPAATNVELTSPEDGVDAAEVCDLPPIVSLNSSVTELQTSALINNEIMDVDRCSDVISSFMGITVEESDACKSVVFKPNKKPKKTFKRGTSDGDQSDTVSVSSFSNTESSQGSPASSKRLLGTYDEGTISQTSYDTESVSSGGKVITTSDDGSSTRGSTTDIVGLGSSSCSNHSRESSQTVSSNDLTPFASNVTVICKSESTIMNLSQTNSQEKQSCLSDDREEKTLDFNSYEKDEISSNIENYKQMWGITDEGSESDNVDNNNDEQSENFNGAVNIKDLCEHFSMYPPMASVDEETILEKEKIVRALLNLDFNARPDSRLNTPEMKLTSSTIESEKRENVNTEVSTFERSIEQSNSTDFYDKYRTRSCNSTCLGEVEGFKSNASCDSLDLSYGPPSGSSTIPSNLPSVEDAFQGPNSSKLWAGITPSPAVYEASGDDDEWVKYQSPGQITSIAVAPKYVCCIDSVGIVRYSYFDSPGLEWHKTMNSASQIAVSSSGRSVWRVMNGKAHYLQALNPDRPLETGWLEVMLDICHIAADDYTAWLVTNPGKLFLNIRDGSESRTVEVKCPQLVKRVSCYKGVVWILTRTGELFCRQGVKFINPAGEKWLPINRDDLQILSVTVGDGVVWVVDSNSIIWFRTGVTLATPAGNRTWWEVCISPYIFQGGDGKFRLMKSLRTFKGLLQNNILSETWNLLTSHSSHSSLTPSLHATTNGVWLSSVSGNGILVNRKVIIGHTWEAVSWARAGSILWQSFSASSIHDKRGYLWLISSVGTLHCLHPFTKQWVNSSKAIKLPEAAATVTCVGASSTWLWILTSSGKVFIKDCQPGTNFTSDWDNLDLTQIKKKKLTHLSCGEESVWACDANGQVHVRFGTPAAVTRCQIIPAWYPLEGGPLISKVYVCADSTKVWALGPTGNVYVRDGITSNHPVGTKWLSIAGVSQATALAVCATVVYVLDKDGKIYKRCGNTETNPNGDYWRQIPGIIANVAVTSEGELWGLNEGKLYQHVQQSVEFKGSATCRPLPLADSPEIEDGWEIL